MSGLRVGHEPLLLKGLRLPGLAKRANALGQLPPLGLLTIGGLADERWHVELISDDGRDPCPDTVERILATAPDLIAFSSLTPSIDRGIQISESLRAKKKTTVIGGLHATAYPDYCLPHFDVVACGDGESTFPQILDDFLANNLHPIYRGDGKFHLDHAPLPRWDLLGERT